MITLLLGLLLVMLVVWAAFYIVGQMGLPQPIRTIVLVIVGVVCLVLLFSYVGLPPLPRGRWG